MDPQWTGIGTEETDSFMPHITNRLSLDCYLDGCKRFLQLTKERSSELVEVEFLSLSSNEALISQAVTELPIFSKLRCLVLKGGHLRDEMGRCEHGLLTSLPSELCRLTNLSLLDLSFNSFTDLPSCVTSLSSLSALHLSYNQLQKLPDDIGNLVNLTFLSLMSNQLVELPAGIGKLKKLEELNLAENRLESLPPEIGGLQSCTELDLSGNCIRELPETTCDLMSLKQLHVHSNWLDTVPAGLASLPQLSCLDLRNNRLRFVPVEILNCTQARLQGNPIGEPEAEPPNQDDTHSSKIRILYLKLNDDCFPVTPDGCRVFLPCGTQIYFPPLAVSSTLTIYFQTLPPGNKHVRLSHHDVLLSSALELRPHGIQFHQDVEIVIPCISPRSLQNREIVIRTFTDQNWTDLHTTTSMKSIRQMWATCRTPHFSWFIVVLRLVEDCCKVPAEGKLLFSSVSQHIRVDFPAGATEETRTVRMQVLPVRKNVVTKITEDPDSVTSPLLCLSQSSTNNFLRPVKIQLPLPPGVTGDSLDRSCLFLLHGDSQAQTWTDITSQVELEISHIYARFHVDHFSWYWLWYTTKSYVSELAKNVYKRVRMYQVNFVALQRKRDPEQVLLQCLPKHKVDVTIKRLRDRYNGPEPSDLVDLVEGEQFFAAFEQGLKLHSDRPDCKDGRLSFIFYSRMKNMKEVYVTSSSERTEKPVKGQVSFYRGSVPEGLPDEATKRRKGSHSEWMATLPLKLPKLKELYTETTKQRIDHSLPPLNLGNAEMGYLTETNLLSIARQIGTDWIQIGMNLDLSYGDLERIKHNNREDLDRQILDMLFLWARRNSTHQDCVERLVKAMKESNRTDIAEEIQNIVTLGKQKYSESIRRIGLDQGNSSEDSAIALSQ
ncbi:p53-induced death domain-containing protein 1 [Spea bombifrons]|uniref:p53-induced death domain-containing protein 1 n=1 Tax=Spea bombifrons TaxID=233779 RepID=UPI00234A17E5|nr:p53-induced death domain-containing protein 1 [Spea bombifrons]XP_053304592.1 p53-induced death domain-containing protein 1 [Spea bombifrons]